MLFNLRTNLGIGDWGLGIGIGDWGLGIGPNPHSLYINETNFINYKIEKNN